MSDPPHFGQPSEPDMAFSAAFRVMRFPHSWHFQGLAIDVRLEYMEHERAAFELIGAHERALEAFRHRVASPEDQEAPDDGRRSGVHQSPKTRLLALGLERREFASPRACSS